MKPQRENMLNLPAVVSYVILALAAIRVAGDLLPGEVALDLNGALAFVPARLSFLLAPGVFMRAFPQLGANGFDESDVAQALGGGGPWTLLTYSLLHANWTHLIVNSVALAAFGSPVARRFGAPRFLLFLAAAAIAGALAHLLLHPFGAAPIVGASAAVAGTMGASARFAFQPGAPLGEPCFSPIDGGVGAMAPPLREALSNSRVFSFLAMWLAANLVSGLFPGAAGASGPIAWEAHIGGFAAGLVGFSLFDRPWLGGGGGRERRK